jgi:hypothetical protein
VCIKGRLFFKPDRNSNGSGSKKTRLPSGLLRLKRTLRLFSRETTGSAHQYAAKKGIVTREPNSIDKGREIEQLAASAPNVKTSDK